LRKCDGFDDLRGENIGEKDRVLVCEIKNALSLLSLIKNTATILDLLPLSEKYCHYKKRHPVRVPYKSI